MQETIVYIILAAVALIIIHRLLRLLKSPSCNCNDCKKGCNDKGCCPGKMR